MEQPDLPNKIKEGKALTPYNRETFYIPESPIGYVDYPLAVGDAVMSTCVCKLNADSDTRSRALEQS